MNLPEYKTFDEKARFFAPENLAHGYPFVINTTEEFDKLYDILQREQTNSGNRLLFRGVSEAKYQNFTSAQRLWLKNECRAGCPFDMMIDNALCHIKQNNILKEYLLSLNVVPNDLYYLTFLQHFGAPTPMLDFSHDLNMGLFFAFDYCDTTNPDNEIENYVSLYLYDTRAYITQIANLVDMLADSMRQAVKMVDDFKKKNPHTNIDDSLLRNIAEFAAWKNPRNAGDGLCKINIALLDTSPKNNQVRDISGNQLFWTNIRIVAQKGCLMWYPNESLSLDNFLYNQIKRPLRCFNFHKSLKSHVATKINLSRDSIYPDEKSISQNVKTQMEVKLIV